MRVVTPHGSVVQPLSSPAKEIGMEKSDSGILRAGVARTDITPPEDCFLEGFAGRDHSAEGIHDPLKVTALALSRNNRRAVFVSMDILDLPDALIDRIWEKAEHHYHLEPRELLLNASHTHAGPMTWSRVPNPSCTDPKQAHPDERYIHRLVENIVTAIGMALGDLRPAHAYWGSGETQIGICRRAQNTAVYHEGPSGYLGIYANYPNPLREIDRTCPVMFLTTEQEEPLALVFGASCHPTTMSHDNYLISAEYPGVTRRILEERFNAPALFLQGIAGDVKPARVAEENGFRSGNFADVEQVGAELAEDVLRIMDQGLRPLDINIRRAVDRFPRSPGNGVGRRGVSELFRGTSAASSTDLGRIVVEEITGGGTCSSVFKHDTFPSGTGRRPPVRGNRR